ncbi:hypothetical protein [Pseudorhodoferax sp. Leaf274]|uniref:hypothetical protein n=1 Tax=Pseudorhodoferax sp. Leaf274 TaxID=1736318 RepID=UPI0012E0FF75|nr:hypothetical protein [Pseudorhodoferax sp. Leaf274]
MNREAHAKFSSFLDGISQSQKLREEFLADPISELRKKLEYTDAFTEEHIGLANGMLLSVLAKPDVIRNLVDLHQRQKAGDITADEKTLATANSLVAAAPAATQEKIKQTWGGGDLTIEKLKAPGPAAIANLWVAANETAIVNHFVVHNTEYVTSGAKILKRNELIKLANELTRNV